MTLGHMRRLARTPTRFTSLIEHRSPAPGPNNENMVYCVIACQLVFPPLLDFLVNANSSGIHVHTGMPFRAMGVVRSDASKRGVILFTRDPSYIEFSLTSGGSPFSQASAARNVVSSCTSPAQSNRGRSSSRKKLAGWNLIST